MEQEIDLKALRGSLSQEAFAKVLGVTQVTVSRWERGGVTRYARLLIEQKLKAVEIAKAVASVQSGQGATVS